MWYLEAFDRTSEFLIADYPLRTLRTSTLSELLGLGDSVEIGGHTYPLEAGGYDVTESALHKLAGYLDDPRIIDQEVDFQVAFYSESDAAARLENFRAATIHVASAG